MSVRSLREQGGPAHAAEVERFLRHPLAEEAMDVRRWDDEAKVPGAATIGLDELVDISVTVGVEKTGAEK